MNRFSARAWPLTLLLAGAAFCSPRDARADTSRRSFVEHQSRLLAQNRALVQGLKGQLNLYNLAPSRLLRGRSLQAWVYLPPGYDSSKARLPVAYILHGSPGTVRDLFVGANVHRVAEKLILEGRIQPMILVGWEGAGPKGADDPVCYLDRGDGNYQMETWMIRELVPWVDSHFRTRAQSEARALVGFSAGGYGAANLCFKHPEVFAIAAAHAGFFAPGDYAQVIETILGPPSKRWEDNSPLLRARRLPFGGRIHFYMDCGRDDSLLGEFEKMEAELRARNIDFEAHVFGGGHDWDFLHAHYFDSLRFCDERFHELENPDGKGSSFDSHSRP